MILRQIHEPGIAQYAYLVACQQTKEAVIIDPTLHIDTYHELAESLGVTIVAAMDTHIHADYLSGLRIFAEQGIKVYVSALGGPDWQYEWIAPYQHQLLKEGDTVRVGNVELKALHTPGHTPEHLAYIITDHARSSEPFAMLSGDFIFVGDLGRADLLESAAGQVGAAKQAAKLLHASVQKLKGFPDSLLILPGHGAGSACGKSLGATPFTTLGYERHTNPIYGLAEEAFVIEMMAEQPTPPRYYADMKRLNRSGPPMRTPSYPVHGSSQGVLVALLSMEEYLAAPPANSLFAPPGTALAKYVGSFLEVGETISVTQDDVQAIRALQTIGYTVARIVTQYDVLSFATTTWNDVPADASLLDVRNPFEHERDPRPARNIPYEQLRNHMQDIPPNPYVFCVSGMRALAAASFLRLQGIMPVVILP